MSADDGTVRVEEITRRTVLKAGAIAAVTAVGGGTLASLSGAAPARAAGTDAGGYEVIANAFGFGIDIPGCPEASNNIREIAIDELSIDCRELTTGLDTHHRRYRSGTPRFGQARFTFRVPEGGTNREIKEWFTEAASGKKVRKDITVTLKKRDGTPARRYHLTEVCPVEWSSVNFDTSSTVQTETLTVKMGRIEFKT